MGVQEKLAEKLKDLEAGHAKQHGISGETGTDPDDMSASSTEQENGNQADGQSTPDDFNLNSSAEETADNLSQAEASTPKQERVNWKKRFTNLKSYHDAKMGELSRQISDQFQVQNNLQKEMEKMFSELQELRANANKVSARDLASPEELKIIGEEGINSIDKLTQRAVDARMEETNKEIARMKEIQRLSQERLANEHSQSATEVFMSKLKAAVPNVDTINVDPGFATWLNEADPIDGRSRMSLFKSAQRAGNVVTVANYFREYEGLKPLTGKQKLENKITPIGATGSPDVQTHDNTQQATETISMRDINQFTADVTKGLYKGREDERKAKAARIDRAFVNNMIVP